MYIRCIVKYINKHICTIMDTRSYMHTMFYCVFSAITPTITKTIPNLSHRSYSLMLRA